MKKRLDLGLRETKRGISECSVSVQLKRMQDKSVLSLNV